VNPLAAYALSRFRPKHTYAILLYLLLTMAFPPMVTQIPLFLMLRDFGLLNSFWALWLPGMVHGYSIFLLKGFFDSLPRDLYESAALDGASELRMFTTITLGLSKPILAVIALQAFVTAYTAFMFALLICQDPRMWTVMVWLYQLQQTYGPGVQNAAYVLAAVPTLLAFLLAQRHILKGIVIPTEK
jgi:multiple sugar transport system permease protein